MIDKDKRIYRSQHDPAGAHGSIGRSEVIAMICTAGLLGLIGCREHYKLKQIEHIEYPATNQVHQYKGANQWNR